MQQLSGSSGRGGTKTPAISVLRFRIASSRSALSAGPASREPKIIRAFSCAEAGSAEVSGPDVVDGDDDDDDVASPPLSLGFLAGAFLTVLRGDLGDDVGGSSGLTSGIGWGLLSTAS